MWATTVGGGETDDERLGHYDAQKNIRGVVPGTLGNAEHQPNETNQSGNYEEQLLTSGQPLTSCQKVLDQLLKRDSNGVLCCKGIGTYMYRYVHICTHMYTYV